MLLAPGGTACRPRQTSLIAAANPALARAPQSPEPAWHAEGETTPPHHHTTAASAARFRGVLAEPGRGSARIVRIAVWASCQAIRRPTNASYWATRTHRALGSTALLQCHPRTALPVRSTRRSPPGRSRPGAQGCVVTSPDNPTDTMPPGRTRLPETMDRRALSWLFIKNAPSPPAAQGVRLYSACPTSTRPRSNPTERTDTAPRRTTGAGRNVIKSQAGLGLGRLRGGPRGAPVPEGLLDEGAASEEALRPGHHPHCGLGNDRLR